MSIATVLTIATVVAVLLVWRSARRWRRLLEEKERAGTLPDVDKTTRDDFRGSAEL